MAILGNLMERIKAAAKAFREPYVTTTIWDDDFYDFNARMLRYAMYWSFYENTPYVESALHSWARSLKTSQGTYRHIRAIFNIAPRLGTFWQTHLLGGYLDMEAGDGDPVPSAIPIDTDNEFLRPAIAQVWKWSNWQQRKDVLSLYGATMGDSAIRVVDVPTKQRTYLEVIHPGMIGDVSKDAFGHVKAYTLVDLRCHPETGQEVQYTEKCWRADDGSDLVYYQTFSEGQPYAWNGEAAEWAVPYGFVPFVHIPHNDIGKAGGGFGWAEIHQGWRKIVELDDAGSLLNDQIRKVIQPIWMLLGGSWGNIEIGQSASSSDNPHPGREEVPNFSISNENAKLQPMVAPLDIASAGEQRDKLIEELERDYPEIRYDLKTVSGDASGRALGMARQAVTSKVEMRRLAYDRALVHAHQMAIAIAGERGYAPEFRGFNLSSFARGDLDHTIGQRPVFSTSRNDRLIEDKMFWETVKIATETGMPLELALAANGYPEDKIAEYQQYQRRQQITAIRQQARQNGGQRPTPPPQARQEEEGTPDMKDETTENDTNGTEE